MSWNFISCFRQDSPNCQVKTYLGMWAFKCIRTLWFLRFLLTLFNIQHPLSFCASNKDKKQPCSERAAKHPWQGCRRRLPKYSTVCSRQQERLNTSSDQPSKTARRPPGIAAGRRVRWSQAPLNQKWEWKEFVPCWRHSPSQESPA